MVIEQKIQELLLIFFLLSCMIKSLRMGYCGTNGIISRNRVNPRIKNL